MLCYKISNSTIHKTTAVLVNAKSQSHKYFFFYNKKGLYSYSLVQVVSLIKSHCKYDISTELLGEQMSCFTASHVIFSFLIHIPVYDSPV